jgi:hypothetical protein
MRYGILSMVRNDRGMVLVMALVLMGLLGALAGVYAMLVRADTVLSGGASRAREGFYAAEAGLNVGMAHFAELFSEFDVPSGDDLDEQILTVGDRTVRYNLNEVSGYAPCTEEDPECYTTIPAGEKFAGLKTIPYRYRARSVAENSEGDEEAELGAEFDVNNIPIFQFLAFSVPDLYIMPAPSMTLNGRIHSNGNLYLNVNSGATLTIADAPPNMPFVSVSSVGHIYRGGQKSYTGQICTGTVTIDTLLDTVSPSGNLDPRNLDCVGDGSSPVVQTTLDAYAGSLLDELDDIQVPDMDSLDRGGDGVFWQKADLRIVLRLDMTPASIDFGATNLCPNASLAFAGPMVNTRQSQALYPIEVQDASGARDTEKTNALWRFMCERRGAIFYTDRHANWNSAPANNTSYTNTRTNYTPSFPDPGVAVSPNASSDDSDLVYRRAGEDTNGDGVVNNGDRNDDICPIALNAATAAPVWRPSYCNTVYGAWPNLTPRASSWYRDYDYRRGGFYNHREGKWLYMLNVNIRALIDWNELNSDVLFSHTDSSNGGLVFFLSVQGADSDAEFNGYGVRIFDAADLNTGGSTFPWPVSEDDPTGLTVVSDQAVYVQGNYNSVQKYPAAVIGDAINVLSQGWEVPMTGSGTDPRDNDRKSAADLSTGRRDVPAQDGYWVNNLNGTHTLTCAPTGCGAFNGATSLRVNAAMISGIDEAPEGDGYYNGGLENFPRFLESWDSRTLNYSGSFVTLGLPQHQKNDWAVGSGDSGNVYDPPTRVWNYDTAFNQVEWLPPLTPMITYIQQRMYTRFYQ